MSYNRLSTYMYIYTSHVEMDTSKVRNKLIMRVKFYFYFYFLARSRVNTHAYTGGGGGGGENL